MSQKRQTIYYKDKTSGKEPAKEWIDSMKDKMGKAKIFTRIGRAENGNLGDHSSVGDGVFELRIDFGPGYRVYFGLEGSELIVLLVVGDKSSQTKDISKAKEFWASHKNDRIK